MTFLKVIFVWIETEGCTHLCVCGNDLKIFTSFMGAILDLLRLTVVSTARICNGIHDECSEMLIYDSTAFHEDRSPCT